jgi:hypothetical protein
MSKSRTVAVRTLCGTARTNDWLLPRRDDAKRYKNEWFAANLELRFSLFYVTFGIDELGRAPGF